MKGHEQMDLKNRFGAVCFYQISILHDGKSETIWQKGTLFSESEDTVTLDTTNFPPTGTELKTLRKDNVIITNWY